MAAYATYKSSMYERKLTIDEFTGIDQSRGSCSSDYGSSPQAKNFICRDGRLYTCSGATQYGVAAPMSAYESSNGRLFQAFFRDSDGNDFSKVIMALHGRFYASDLDCSSWSAISAGFATNDWSAVNYRDESHDWIIFTNGKDGARYWDGVQAGTLPLKPTQGATEESPGKELLFSKLTLLNERLWGGVSAEYPDRIYWSNTFDAEDWEFNYVDSSNDGGGFVDVATFDGTRIRAIISAFDDVLIFKDKSVHRLSGTYAFAEKLFATEAFIRLLRTEKIVGENSIEIIAGEASDALNKVDNLQIGGRNLLLKSATKHISAYAGATLTFTEGVSVSEWGATDAIHCAGTGGTSTTFGTLSGVSVNAVSVMGQDYVHSIYVRNDGSSRINITNNSLGGSEYVAVGESRRVVLKNKGDDYHKLQLEFKTAAAGDEINITYWHPKIELGNMATDWSPAPEDNPDMFTADTPPGLPLKTGTIWIDTGVTPTVIRRWKGTGTSTDRDEDGWDTVSDLDEISEISNKLRAQQAEAQKAIDQLATAITIDTSGAHFYKPGYRDRSEVRIDQDSVDIVVGGNVNSSFIAGGLILGNYMLWHPAAAGGLAFNLYSEA